MSTLPQIESAVADLPTQEQWKLLNWLQGRLASPPVHQPPQPDAEPHWLDEVRSIRRRCATGKSGTPVEQLISEIRS